MDTTPRASGRCLCGAVSFQVRGELRDIYNCRCHRCRRFTGHHMAATATNVADLTIEDADSNLRWFYPVPEAGYAFCPPTGLKTVQAWWTSEASDYHVRPDLPEFETE